MRKVTATIRHNSADSVPTSILFCVKMAPNHEILNMAVPLANNLKLSFFDSISSEIGRPSEQSIIKIFLNELNFHRLFDGIFKVVFSFQWILTL